MAHLDGSLHPTSHIWIVRRNHSSGWDLLLQKRSLSKDSNPGCYDISSAGHVSAGDTYLPAALRELGEELGIRAEEEDLHLAGMRKAYFEDVFYGKPFRIMRSAQSMSMTNRWMRRNWSFRSQRWKL